MYDASQLPKVIYGINWTTRTFNRNDPESPQDEVVEKKQEAATPKPKEPKKEAVVIEVMPDEPMPKGYADYRPLLQRDVQLKTNLQATGCETTPEPPYTKRKIPFPGVKLSEPDRFQIGFDNFLQKMGYIE
jgi:hypothetical protein